jgi:hypothetical protein
LELEDFFAVDPVGWASTLAKKKEEIITAWKRSFCMRMSQVRKPCLAFFPHQQRFVKAHRRDLTPKLHSVLMD